MFQLNTSNPEQNPSSPDRKSIFSFYTQEPSNFNPFNPTHVSTLRKSHHVSMPTLPSRPKPQKLTNRLSLDNLHRPIPKFQKQPTVTPFRIRVQSRVSNAVDNLDSQEVFTRPKRGRRSLSGASEGQNNKRRHLNKGGVSWWKKGFLCGSVSNCKDLSAKRQRAYYFI